MSANDVTHKSPNPAVLAAIRAHADWAGGLLPALHAVQHAAGYIDKTYIPLLADTFNLSTAEVYGVITFYKDFRTEAPKGPIVQVCRAEACISRGGKATELRALELGATLAVEIEEVFCLGLCAQGPAAATGGRMFIGVDEVMIETIIGDALRRAPAPVASRESWHDNDSVGVTDGGSVGVTDGGSVGVTDGGSVGVTDSDSVGVTDGGSVGVTDGGSVGVTDSHSVGVTDGDGVCVTDGGSVGVTDGDGVGVTDGGSVGVTDSHSVGGTGGDGVGVTVYVPRDAAARAAGADEVAAALAGQGGIRVVRNGSRGMLWLEPLVEVVTPQGRIAYGPVGVDDVPGLIAAGLTVAGEHPLQLGLTEALPWMLAQQRVTYARVGVIDPRDADEYEAHGGMVGLRAALAMQPTDVVTEVTQSGLRGRGGAAFPSGIKLRTVLETPSTQKYIVCNADEGDSGSFADRMLMEGDPFLLIEGMIIAGWATGASDGFIYIRSEYPDAIEAIRSAIATCEARGWLNGFGSEEKGVMGTDFVFRLHVRIGAGAYICGEETALMESIEGKRGIVRAKPPLPAIAGLWGKPTVINNVLSLAALPTILADGAAAYAALGHGRSRGTQVVQVAGNVAHGGIFEAAFGITVRELVEQFGGGSASGRPVRAVQVGGPLGAYLAPEQFDLPIDYEAFAAAGALLGHGSMVVFDDTVDMLGMARFAMEFCAIESCGKCTPCRIGSTRGVELIDKIIAGERRDENMTVLMDLCEVMADASLCAMGGFTPLPVRSAIAHFVDSPTGANA